MHACRPFHGRVGVDWVDRFRDGIRQLSAWSDVLDDGARINAWATPVDPQLHAEPPAVVEHVEPLNGGRGRL